MVLEEAAVQILHPLVSLWQSFVDVFPGIVAAIIILIIGYFIALLLGHVVRIVLSKLKVDNVLGKVNAPKSVSKVRVSSILGQLTKWYVFIVFLGSAAEVLELGALSELLVRFVLWLPQLIIAILAVFLGLIVAYYVSHIIETEAKVKGAKALGSMFKFIVLFIAIIIALEQIGIEVSILENTFLILIGGVALGAAIALGISFGQGLKGPVAQFIANMKKRL